VVDCISRIDEAFGVVVPRPALFWAIIPTDTSRAAAVRVIILLMGLNGMVREDPVTNKYRILSIKSKQSHW
jgi:hypothetical protein